MLSWCRLCLKRSDNFHSLLDSKILNKIESLTSLKFDLNDKLPQNCCQSCVDNVITSYNFQQIVLEAVKWWDANLSEIHQNADPPVTETYEVQQEANYGGVEPKLETTENVYKSEVDLGPDFNVDGVQEYIQNDETKVAFSYTDGGFINENVAFDDASSLVYENFEPNSSSVASPDSFISDIPYAEEGFVNNVTYDETSSLVYENYEPTSSSVTSPESFVSDTISNIPVEDETSFEQSSDNIEGEFSCCDCNLKFSTKRNLEKHKMKHNIEQCPHCAVSMRRDNLKRHIQKHIDLPIECGICGAVAKNRESLRGHHNYHHRDNPVIKCDECPKEFKSAHHYKTHQRKVHLNIKNAQCEYCGHKFFANHDLIKHIRMKHHKERPYPCPECSKHFSSRYALQTHMRQHNGEKPFACQLCDLAFKQKVSLKNHVMSKHNLDNNPEPGSC